MELEIEKSRVENLQETLNEMKLEKEVLEDKLRKSEAQRVQDKEAMEVQRKQDKFDTDAQMNELRSLFKLGQQPSFSSNTQIQKQAFFKL